MLQNRFTNTARLDAEREKDHDRRNEQQQDLLRLAIARLRDQRRQRSVERVEGPLRSESSDKSRLSK